MEVRTEGLLLDYLIKCPKGFRDLFIYMLEQIEAAKSLNGLEGIKPIGGSKEYFKMEIDKSKIGLLFKNKQVIVTCFIFNQFYKND